MILHEINYRMPIYRDCTLVEILCAGAMVFFSEIILLSLLTRILAGYAVIGVALTFMSFFHLTRFVLNKLQRLKYGKPYGYYKHLLIKKCGQSIDLSNWYLVRQGKWSIRRTR